MGFNDEAISCNLSVDFRYPLWTHLRNLVSVTVSTYALERIIAACVEGWMNKYGGSQVAAQINVLQGDVTTSNRKSLNLTTSTNKSASDILISGLTASNKSRSISRNRYREYTAHHTNMMAIVYKTCCVRHAVDFIF